MTRRLMIDTETLGTDAGCIILSIAAVEFQGDQILNEFHVKIDPLDSERQGLKPQASTVMWWLEQDEQARNALLEGEKRTLQGALMDFAGAFKWKDLQVWCNGASFDFPILKAAFAAVGMPTPWAFYNEMDFRTMKNLLGKPAMKTLTVKPEIAHDALEDARAQAKTLMNVFDKLGV